MTFGSKVKELRKKKGLTQSALSEVVGVAIRTVVYWEKNQCLPNKIETYQKLADALGCDISYLSSGENAAFMAEVEREHGTHALDEARNVLDQAKALCAGGQVPEEDFMQFMIDIQQIYLDSKKRSGNTSSPDQGTIK